MTTFEPKVYKTREMKHLLTKWQAIKMTPFMLNWTLNLDYLFITNDNIKYFVLLSRIFILQQQNICLN